MPFAIELFFDDITEAAVQQVWSALAERRIAPYLRESANRPHVSLAVSERLDVAGCARGLGWLFTQVCSTRPPSATGHAT